MDYVHEMRQKIGHDPLILAGAAVLVINDQSEILMMLRTDNHQWGLPGGAMNIGETMEQTAIRETLEETGLRVSQLELLDVFSGPEFIYQYPNGDITVNVSAVYIAHDVPGEIALNLDEHSEWKYFPLSHLPENISPPIKPVLARYVLRTYR